MKPLPLLALLFLHGSWALSRHNNRLESVQLIQQGDIALRSGRSTQALFNHTNAIRTDLAFADAYRR